MVVEEHVKCVFKHNGSCQLKCFLFVFRQVPHNVAKKRKKIGSSTVLFSILNANLGFIKTNSSVLFVKNEIKPKVMMIATESNTSSGCCSAPGYHKKLLIVTVLLLLLYTSTGNKVKDKNFDYFVFSQRWLPTSCIEYEEHNFSHECTLPKNYQFWAIHGLWPTQNNHLGPFFCNRSMSFDINKLSHIEPILEMYWPNIEGGKSISSLWQHEWDKHGTCAAQLKSLDTEFKYFSVTLNLFKTYSIQNLFQKDHIKPSLQGGLNVIELFNIIKSEFGYLPQISCIHEVKTKRPYLAEIRLCFDKNLKLMDCGNMVGVVETIKSFKFFNGLTNCPEQSKIIYPDSVDPEINYQVLLDSSVSRNYYNKLHNILNILKFLMWASI